MSLPVHGETEILYIWNGSDAYEPVVCLTSNGLSENVAEITSRTKCDTGGATQRRAGAYTYEIPFEGVYNEPETGKVGWNSLKTKLRSLGTFTWRLSTTYSDDSVVNEYGTAYFSNLEKTAPMDDNITFSGSLMGSGLITDTDPNAWDSVSLLDNAIGYYKFNETSGSILTDELGSLNGVYNNSPTLGELGILGTAVRFNNSVTNQDATVASNANLSIQNGGSDALFSIGFWIYPSSTAGYLVGKSSNTSGNYEWEVGLSSGNIVFSNL